ncbi:hypothetical protein Tco_0082008, partial [Tanacetum coccineum]
DLHELVGLVSRIVNLMYTLAPSANVAAEGEKESQSQPEKTTDDIQTTKVPTPAKGEPQTTEASVGQNSSALVVHSTDEIHEQLLSKKLKVVMEIPNKGNVIAQSTDDDALKEITPYINKGGSTPSLSSLHFKAAGTLPMTIEGAQLQLQETKRIADLKAAKEKSEEKLKRLTLEQLKAQEQELAEIESQRAQHLNKMRDEYLNCINFKVDPLPITKFLYRVNKSTKIASMCITRNNQPLSYRVYKDFRLKTLGFT